MIAALSRAMGVPQNFSRFRTLLKARSRDRRFAVFAARPGVSLVVLALLAGASALLFAFADPHVREIRDAVPASLRPVFEFFSWLGEGIVIYALCLALVLFSLVRDLSEQRPRVRAHDLTRAAAALYVLTAVVVAGIAAAALKFVIGRARPRLMDEHGSFAFDMFGPGSSWASFPSGHATTIMSCAVALALIFPRRRIALLIAGVVISFGRVAVGAHYPADIAGGAVLGALVAWLFARALAQRRIVFRFDGHGRLKPLHYIGRNFIARGAQASRARSQPDRLPSP